MNFVQYLIESDDPFEDDRRHQRLLSQQLDILLDKLRKYEKEGLIHISEHTIPGVHPDDLLSYKLMVQRSSNLSVATQTKVRFVHLLTDRKNVNDYIKVIVDRINRIWQMGGVYY